MSKSDNKRKSWKFRKRFFNVFLSTINKTFRAVKCRNCKYFFANFFITFFFCCLFLTLTQCSKDIFSTSLQPISFGCKAIKTSKKRGKKILFGIFSLLNSVKCFYNFIAFLVSDVCLSCLVSSFFPSYFSLLFEIVLCCCTNFKYFFNKIQFKDFCIFLGYNFFSATPTLILKVINHRSIFVIGNPSDEVVKI